MASYIILNQRLEPIGFALSYRRIEHVYADLYSVFGEDAKYISKLNKVITGSETMIDLKDLESPFFEDKNLQNLLKEIAMNPHDTNPQPHNNK